MSVRLNRTKNRRVRNGRQAFSKLVTDRHLFPLRHILRRANHFASRVLLLEDAAGHHGVGGGDNSVLGGGVGAVKAEGDFELAMSHRRIRFEGTILLSGAPKTWTKFGDKLLPDK